MWTAYYAAIRRRCGKLIQKEWIYAIWYDNDDAVSLFFSGIYYNYYYMSLKPPIVMQEDKTASSGLLKCFCWFFLMLIPDRDSVYSMYVCDNDNSTLYASV